jgi:tRNA (uracil-5-)-methyltransferase
MGKKRSEFERLAETFRDGTGKPPCAYFGMCGGCSLQDIAYEGQLVLKREYLRSVLGLPVGDVRPSPPYSYRNRMDFVCAFQRIGLRRRGSFRHVVDIERCPIMQERSGEVFSRLRPLLAEVEDYDYRRHSGYLRYVVLRQGRFTGQVMLNLVLAHRENRLEGVIAAVEGHVDSLSLLFTDRMADVSHGEVFEDVKGGAIEETLDGLRFGMGPNSFFQSNSAAALDLYRRIRDEAEGRVLDLYCGVGSISLFIAGVVERVTGVELSEEGAARAELNRDLNGIRNVGFVRADVLSYLKDAGGDHDTVILDPPRAGLHPRVVQELARAAPEKILYVSCNPAHLKNDLAALSSYRLESCEAFDMFPQTPHVEMLAVLKRT